MTIAVQHDQFDPSLQDLAQPVNFDHERGRFLDAFNELEFAVGAWLIHLGARPSIKVSFSHRVMELANHANLTTKAGKNQAERVKNLPAECEVLIDVRNAMVHGRRMFGNVGPRSCVLLQNITDALADRPQFIVLTQAQLASYTAGAHRLATLLEGWRRQKINPASSPLPPSTGAAGDP